MADKRPSLAIDLAKQAAAAALAETQAAAAPPPMASSRWQPASLPQGFALDRALQRAVHQVAGHLGQWLRHEGLEVTTTPQALPINKADNPPQAPIRVLEQGNGRVVRGYSESAVLGLFASQQQRNGVVVDGQV